MQFNKGQKFVLTSLADFLIQNIDFFKIITFLIQLIFVYLILTESKTLFGCSAGLLAAIERGEEATLRQMLSDKQVQYRDTVWLPTGSQFKLINPLNIGISIMSSIPANFPNILHPKQCPHPIVTETLIAGDLCAVSVVMSAMLFSTVDFNVLQILIKSGRFDFQEPLVYHCRNPFQVTEEVDENCSLVVVSPLGMALLIDAIRGTSGGFLLTRTLIDSTLVTIDSEFIGMRCDHYRHNNGFNNEWRMFRARGPIAFLYEAFITSLCYYTKRQIFEYSQQHLALIEMLCDVGFELKSPLQKQAVNWFAIDNVFILGRRQRYTVSVLHAISSFVYVEDLNSKSEYIIKQLIRMGLVFPERRATSRWQFQLYRFVNALHVYKKRNNCEDIQQAVYRLCRQLFALGLFREPDVSADPNIRGLSDVFTIDSCSLSLNAIYARKDTR